VNRNGHDGLDGPLGYTTSMVTAPSSRLRWLEHAGLVVLPLAPLGFLALVASQSRGKDLSVVFYTGSAVLFALGACLVTLGIRRQRSSRKWSGGLTMASVLLFGFFGATGIYWVGSKTLVLTVEVLDSETGGPVPNASVRVYIAEYSWGVSEVQTDSDGRVDLNHEFKAAGYSSLLNSYGSINLSRESLRVEAAGYQLVHEPLYEHTGLGWPLYGSALPAVKVSLKRRHEREEPTTAEALLRIVEDENLPLKQREDAAADLQRFKEAGVIDRLGKLLPRASDVLTFEIVNTLGAFADSRALPALERLQSQGGSLHGKINTSLSWAIRECSRKSNR
jgi:hypothetical protein